MNKITKVIAGLALILAVFVAGCNIPYPPAHGANPPPAAEPGTGTLSLSFGFNKSRTVFPGLDSLTSKTYSFTRLDAAGNPLEDEDVLNLQPMGDGTFTLRTGKWKLIVNAYAGESLAASGELVFDLGEETISRQILLAGEVTGTGIFVYTIDTPADTAVTVSMKTIPAGTPVANLASGMQLDAGYYFFTLKGEKTGSFGKQLTAGLNEIIHIYNGTTTTFAAQLAGGEFTRPLSSNTGIAAVMAGTAAATGTGPYTAEVDNTIDNVTIDVTPEDPAADVKIIAGSAEYANGASFRLAEGPNVFTITVTAENGDHANYGLTVTRLPPPFVTVASISGVPTDAVAGVPLALAATVNPENATNTAIVWTVQSGEASITDSVLTAAKGPAVTVRAAIADGTAEGTYTQDFIINVFVPVTGITGIPESTSAGSLALNGIVAPTDATNKTITWTVYSAGSTGAVIAGNTLTTVDSGTVVVTATIANGLAAGPYTRNFSIDVTVPVFGIEISWDTNDLDIDVPAQEINSGASLTLSVRDEEASQCRWYVNGVEETASSGHTEYIFDKTAAGTYLVTIGAEKNNRPCSAVMEITVK
jgi:hypothetical protein